MSKIIYNSPFTIYQLQFGFDGNIWKTYGRHPMPPGPQFGGDTTFATAPHAPRSTLHTPLCFGDDVTHHVPNVYPAPPRTTLHTHHPASPSTPLRTTLHAPCTTPRSPAPRSTHCASPLQPGAGSTRQLLQSLSPLRPRVFERFGVSLRFGPGIQVEHLTDHVAYPQN